MHFDEVYNLAAQSFVGASFSQPHLTFNIDTLGVLNLLEGIRKYSPTTRFYQASTSEMFGTNYDHGKEWGLAIDDSGVIVTGIYGKYVYDYKEKYQNEHTKFQPESPYAIAKVAAHHLCQLYRKAYNLHVSCGILFNHESERRGEEFVTRKITKWIARFHKWLNTTEFGTRSIDLPGDENLVTCYGKPLNKLEFPKLRLGNLDAYRDWGHAEDYVKAMHLMLQQNSGDDYVVATGEAHTVREFLKVAFKHIGIENWEEYIILDPKFMRPSDVPYLRGISDKARKNLNWKPEISFEKLVQRMVEGDINGNN